MEWKRVSCFDLTNSSNEHWIYEDEGIEETFNVNINFGKPIDVMKLKSSIVSNMKLEIEKIKTSREALYKKTAEIVPECPICKSNEKVKVLEVYNAQYVNCKQCNHYYVENRPNKTQLEEFYSQNSHYQSTYSDKENSLTRIREVAEPKLDYIIKMYEIQYGKKPKSILDVGAGSGHFVYAARNRGIKADGIELSQHGCEFAKNNFNIDLLSKDFIDCYKDFINYDIVTFWGVIEHTPYPLDMLIAAKKITHTRDSLIVAEVPRYESFSSAVQIINSESIIRHLEPLGHINCFTDSSLATAFVKAGFDITAAWYFGMDSYELIAQLALLNNDKEIIQNIKHYIPSLQDIIDKSRLSDSMVLVGTPRKI